MKLTAAFFPNRIIPKASMQLITLMWVILVIVWWTAIRPPVVPSPIEVISAFGSLWTEDALLYRLGESYSLNLWALGFSTLISACLAYATVLPALRPAVSLYSKFRFLGMTGLTFLFGLVWAQRSLQISLLTFGITVFFVTSMMAIVTAIPKDKFDYARTLRMGEWRVVWEVVIRGTRDQAFESLRQNAAIGWMMLTMIEGLVRSEGGLGVLLLDQNKHFKLANVFAIQLTILAVGLLQDAAIGALRRFLCPYADRKLERK